MLTCLHAGLEHGALTAPPSFTGLRQPGFSPSRLHHPAPFGLPQSKRNRIPEANFRSPTATSPLLGLPRQGRRSCSTSSLPRCLSAVSRSTRASRNATLDFSVSDQQLVARSHNFLATHPQDRFNRHSPSGTSLGIIVPGQALLRMACLPVRPISLRSPQAG